MQTSAGQGGLVGGRAIEARLEGPGWSFRWLTLVTVASLFALITLGGVVRLTGSGLACPDWPLCHGQVVPPLDTPVIIEYSHRLMATVAGLLVLATAIIVWRSHRNQRWLLIPATLGLILLVTQVFLGGVTVLKELPGSIVLAHLATAEALMACMVVVALVALRGRFPTAIWRRGQMGQDRFPLMVLGAVVGGYALLLTGSYVAVSGAAPSCGQSWPLCQGGLLPEGYYPTIHMVHRLVALVVGVLIISVVVQAWRRRKERPAMGWISVAVGGLLLAQVVVGAAVLWTGFSMGGRLLHLTMATLVWMGLAVLAIFSYTGPDYSPRGISRAEA